MKQQGYATECIGKWHLDFTIEGADKSGGSKGKGKGVGAPLGAVTHDEPITRSFDEYFGFHHARKTSSIVSSPMALGEIKMKRDIS